MEELQKREEAPIAIFTALSWENAAVRSVLRHVRREQERVWRGVVGPRDVLIVTGGIGPRRTQQTLEQFEHVEFSAVWSIGCAGALVPGLTTGQLVLAPEVRVHERNEKTRPGEAFLNHFAVDPQLLAYTRAAAMKAKVPTAEGPLYTSPKVLFTPEDKAQHGRATGAIAVEMESGAHAAFAAAQRVPFLVMRVILDGVDMRLPLVKGLTTPEGDIRAFKAAMHVVTHPHHLSALLALKRSRTIAAQSLSRLCHALFSLLDTQPRELA